VRVDCDVCERSGTYRLARLAARYGSEILLDDVLARISADCALAGRSARQWLRSAIFRPPRRPPDMPAPAIRAVAGGKK
jgi:hypothetical protein